MKLPKSESKKKTFFACFRFSRWLSLSPCIIRVWWADDEFVDLFVYLCGNWIFRQIINTPGYRCCFSNFLFRHCSQTHTHTPSSAKLGNEEKESRNRNRICTWCAHEKPFPLDELYCCGDKVRHSPFYSTLGMEIRRNRLSLQQIGSVINLQRFNINKGCRYSWLFSGQVVLFESPWSPITSCRSSLDQPLCQLYPVIGSQPVYFRRFSPSFRTRNIFRSFVHPSSQKERTKNNNNLTKHML